MSSALDNWDFKTWHRLMGGEKAVAAASWLQTRVKTEEREMLQDGLDRYEKEEINQAIVHTREDVVLLVSYLMTTAVASNRIVRRLNVLIGIAVIFLISQLPQLVHDLDRTISLLVSP